MRIYNFVLILSLCLAANYAQASETVGSRQTQGQGSDENCFLSVQQAFKSPVSLQIIPFTEAIRNPSYPKLRDYSKVENAYRSLTADASVKAEKFKYAEMRDFLSKLKSAGSLPSRNAEANQIEKTSEDLSSESKAIFESLKNTMFGDNAVNLKTCADCIALADYATKTVFIQPSYLRDLRSRYGAADSKIVIEFMIAHELSHFVQEASIGLGEKNNLSINGAESVYDHHPEDQDDAQSGRKTHAEVDAYALVVLRSKYSKPPSVIARWFDDEISELKRSNNPDLNIMSQDFESRANSWKAVKQDLWEN